MPEASASGCSSGCARCRYWVFEADFEAGELPDQLEAAYQTLFREAGLSADGAAAAPGADQDEFSPVETARQWVSALGGTDGAGGAQGSPGVLGVFPEPHGTKS